jgi:hypothetical protein
MGAAFARMEPWWGIISMGLLLLSPVLGLVFLRVNGAAIISPEGLRTREDLRWRQISWDDVASVRVPPSIFRLWGGVWVRTTSGNVLPVSLPPKRCEELMAYAQAHRNSPPPSPHGQNS